LGVDRGKEHVHGRAKVRMIQRRGQWKERESELLLVRARPVVEKESYIRAPFLDSDVPVLVIIALGAGVRESAEWGFSGRSVFCVLVVPVNARVPGCERGVSATDYVPHSGELPTWTC
jgi:hypothetical protein